MPFTLTETSSIGGVDLEDASGQPCWIEGGKSFFALFGQPYISQVTAGLDNSQAVAAVARNLAGQFSIRLAWAPATVYADLRELVGAGRQTATFFHPAIGGEDGLTLDVEVLDVTPEGDEQYGETDPARGLTVLMVSHGEPD